MKMKTWLGMLLILVIGGAVPASAQLFTPSFMPPVGPGGVGVYLVDAGDIGIEGRLWRGSTAGYDFAFRGGVLDLGDAALTLGAQLRNPLVLGTDPVELAFTAGAQGLVGDFDSAFGVDAGVSAGAAFTQGNLTIVPYLHPRVALMEGIGGDGLDVEVLADLGVDFVFTSGLSLRLGIPIADEQIADWGIGLTWQ